VSFAIGTFVTAMLMNAPATLDTSAWYFGDALLLIAVAAGLATWGLYVSLAGRLWKMDSLT
jgi:hypothetical protein